MAFRPSRPHPSGSALHSALNPMVATKRACERAGGANRRGPGVRGHPGRPKLHNDLQSFSS
eukprot:6352221-Alexandrium_andersonii.AAC.1